MADQPNPDVTATETEVQTEVQPTEQTSAQEVPQTEAAPKESQDQPQYVTREELERRDAEILRRVKQSSSDRQRQIDKQISEIKDQMATREAPLSPEQESVLRQQIEKQIDGPEPEERNDPSSNDNAIQQLNQFVGAVFAEVGTTVTINDPEFKELQDKIDEAWTIDGPRGLVVVQRAAEKAATAKALRVSSQKKGAAARVVSGGEQRPSGEAPAKSASDLWNKAYDQ
jgi:hypothetical protein